MAKHEQDGNVLEVQKTRLKPPPLYKVILLNDDYTPMDFVVVVLQTVFAMSREKATQVMLQIHRGSVRNVYSRSCRIESRSGAGHRTQTSASASVHHGGDLNVNPSLARANRHRGDGIGTEL
jgi:hypothetical protein